MATPFYDYILRLADSPADLAGFTADPSGEAQKAGITDEHRDALVSGDWQKITGALATEDPNLQVEGKRFGGIFFLAVVRDMRQADGPTGTN